MNAEPRPTVFVVDDDQDMRNSLKWLIESIGLPVETFPSAEDYLAGAPCSRPGCLLVDVRMPGMGGLRLLEYLRDGQLPPPVILLTAHGEVSMAVQALKNGAFDFIQKPGTPQFILERVQDALALDRRNRALAAERAAMAELFAQLTQREREVLDRLVEGKTSRDIAQAMGISERTVEKHRERLMHKMRARSLVHLVRMVVEFAK